MARRDITRAGGFAPPGAFPPRGPALIDEVLAMFREQAALWVRLLDPAGPPDSWRDAAHTLKGSSLGVGAFALAKACDAAEIGYALDPGLKSVQLDHIRDALDAALA